MAQPASHRAPQEVKPATSVRGAPAGAEVTVSLDGLLPYQPVRVSFGSMSSYQNLGRGETDPDGRFSGVFRVPDWAERDRIHYFVVSVGSQVRVLSDPFHVTDADGTARITGTLTVERLGCLTLVGAERTPYTLLGVGGMWASGERVAVTGSVAGKANCGGLPIAVRDIQPAS